MNELSNTITSVGTYNNIETALTSNELVINMIEGLKVTKDADKKNWADGVLTFKITVENLTDMAYTNVVITDVLDTSKIVFIDKSVVINNVTASDDEYSYNDNTLIINLDSVDANTTSTITFQVSKKSV